MFSNAKLTPKRVLLLLLAFIFTVGMLPLNVTWAVTPGDPDNLYFKILTPVIEPAAKAVASTKRNDATLKFESADAAEVAKVKSFITSDYTANDTIWVPIAVKSNLSVTAVAIGLIYDTTKYEPLAKPTDASLDNNYLKKVSFVMNPLMKDNYTEEDNEYWTADALIPTVSGCRDAMFNATRQIDTNDPSAVALATAAGKADKYKDDYKQVYMTDAATFKSGGGVQLDTRLNGTDPVEVIYCYVRLKPKAAGSISANDFALSANCVMTDDAANGIPKMAEHLANPSGMNILPYLKKQFDLPKQATAIATPTAVTGINLGTNATGIAGKLPAKVNVTWDDGSKSDVGVTWDVQTATGRANDTKAGTYSAKIKSFNATDLGSNVISDTIKNGVSVSFTVNTSTIASASAAAGNNTQKYYVGTLPTEANAKALFSKASNIGITPTASTYAGSNLIARDLTWTGTYNQSAAAGTTMTFTGSYTKVGNTADLYTVGTSGDFTNTDKTISATIEVVAKQNLLKDVVKPGVTAADLGLAIGASQADVEAKLNALTGKQTITKAGSFYADVTGITSAMPASYTVKETGTWTLVAGQTWSSAAQSTMKFEKTIAEADIEKVGANDVVSIVPNNHKMTVEVTFGGTAYDTNPIRITYPNTIEYGTTKEAAIAEIKAWLETKPEAAKITAGGKTAYVGSDDLASATYSATTPGSVEFTGTPKFTQNTDGMYFSNANPQIIVTATIGRADELKAEDIVLDVAYSASKADIQAAVIDKLTEGIAAGSKKVTLADTADTTNLDALVVIAGPKMEGVLADINKMIYDISGANAAAATPVKYVYTFGTVDKAQLAIKNADGSAATSASLTADPVVKVTFKPERKLFTVGDISLDTTNSKVAFKLTAKDAADTDQKLPNDNKLIAVATISENGKLVGVVKTVIEGLDTVNAEGYTIDVPSTLTLKDGMTAKVVMINEFGDGKSAVGTVFSSEN